MIEADRFLQGPRCVQKFPEKGCIFGIESKGELYLSSEGMNAATPWDISMNDSDIEDRNVRLFRDVVIYKQEKILYGYRG